MADERPRRLATLSGRLRRTHLRLILATAALGNLSQRKRSLAASLFAIAWQRGPLFANKVTDLIRSEHSPFLIRQVERATRAHLLPGGELARVRAAALSSHTSGDHSVDARVALVLDAKPPSRRTSSEFQPPRSIARRRYIVAGARDNPYVQMINSQIHSVGLTVHYVSGFSGVLQALHEAQSRGETPHVHLDTWLTRAEAVQLIASLRPRSTLSITAHDLEHSRSLRQGSTGASLLLERANAIHLLTASALTRLGYAHLTGDPRVFHVPHPSYYGPHAGSYGLPRHREQARRQLGRNAEGFSVGLVGRISDRKNVELLIEAAEIVHKTNEDIQRPTVFISGSLRTKFAERIIRRSATVPNVVLATDDLDDEVAGMHVAALDAAVVPYHGYLNSGWTLLALSAGIPVIASRESTAHEVVPAASLVEYTEGDSGSLAEAIVRLARRDRSEAERAAREAAEQLHPDLTARAYAEAMAARIFHR